MSEHNSPCPVGLVEIAYILGYPRGTVGTWASRRSLPQPRWTVSGGSAYDLGDVMAWARASGRATLQAERNAEEWRERPFRPERQTKRTGKPYQVPPK